MSIGALDELSLDDLWDLHGRVCLLLSKGSKTRSENFRLVWMSLAESLAAHPPTSRNAGHMRR